MKRPRSLEVSWKAENGYFAPAGFRYPTLGGGQGWRLVRQLWEGGWGVDSGVRGHGFILGRRGKGHEGWEGQWTD